MLLNSFLAYLQHERNYSAHTIQSYRNDILSFELFARNECVKELHTASAKDVRRWIAQLSEQKLSEKTINRKIASLKSFYKFLLKTETITQNPLENINGMKVKRKVPVPFSQEEMNRLFDLNVFPDDFEGIRNKLMINLLYSTGIRRAELIGIKEKDIDFHKKELKVTGKRNKQRIIPLLNNVLMMIKDYINAKNEYFEQTEVNEYLLVTKKGKKIYEMLVYRVINSYLSSVSVKHKKSPHMLRHTFATHLLNNGADLNAIKELLGHSSLAATQVYTHNSIQKLKNVYKNAHPRSKK